MGSQSISCKCLKNCKDSNEEVDLAKGDYLRSRTGNMKINNDPKSLTSFQQIKTVSINSLNFKTENNASNNKNEIKKKETLNNPIVEETEENKFLETNNNNIKEVKTLNDNNEKGENSEMNEKKINETISEKKEQQKEESSHNENNEKIIIGEKEINFENIDNTKSLESINNNLIGNKVAYKPNSSSSLKFKDNFDKSIFFTETLKNAEKNFERPLNYKTDYKQYCDKDNEDMLTIINEMNSNKGENQTPEEGQVIEYKGEKYLYIGELDKHQKPNGFGVLYTTKGTKYEGYFNNFKLTGLGRYINETGTCYEGIFENNKLIGKAKIITWDSKKSKITYFGETENFQKHGEGEEISDIHKYFGEFSRDKWHGHGRLEYLDNGDIYGGDFDHGEITGKGLYIWSNKTEYQGDLVKGVKHGKGKYKWPDGCEYEGDYVNGIREGFGTYKFKNGMVFKGRFKNNTPDGKGKMIWNGKTKDVEYKDGKPTQNLKKLFE